MTQAARKAAGPAPVAEFNWEDPLDLESQLSEDERMIRDSARAFAQDKLAPRVQKAFREEKFDRDIMNELGADGLSRRDDGGSLWRLGARLCRLWPCRARSRARRFRLPLGDERAELARHASDRGLWHGGAEARNICRKLATGEIVGCFGLTEPDAGSDPGGMKTRAAKVQGGYVLNGTKMWITNSPIADIAVVWAKTEDKDIRGFVVERGAKGFSTPKIEGKVSLRASVTGEIVLDNVELPEEALLPNAQGLGGPFGCLNKARFGIAWGVMGAAEDCWHRARQYTLDRKQFGRPLAANQLVQKKLADMQTEIALGLHGALALGRGARARHLPHRPPFR